MLVAGRLYQLKYWLARAECVYRDRRDLHRDHARRVYEQHHDQRFECAIEKLERNGYCRSRSDAGTPSDPASRTDRGERARHNVDAHCCRANAIDWAKSSACAS